MKILEVILDGFKSYSQRVVVSPFSPSFSAITGPNGTGKSNILDGISFVMGIKSLEQMRVSRLEELVYKQGQAGVTTATVTVVFDNTDKSFSPPTLIDKDKILITRQILVGGRDKYLVNGRIVKVTEIQNLFRSIQLNVNQPHFLVMQGRISRVVGMKPKEILALLEEAAGTKAFDEKRKAAVVKLAQKDSTLAEIDTTIAENFEPTLKALRLSRDLFNRWCSLAGDIEIKKRILYTRQLANLESTAKDASIEMENMCDRENQLRKSIMLSEESSLILEKDIQKLKEAYRKEHVSVTAGTESGALAEAEKVEHQLKINEQIKEKEMETETQKLETAKKAFQAASKKLSDFETDQGEAFKQEKLLQAKLARHRETLKNLEEQAEAARLGGCIMDGASLVGFNKGQVDVKAKLEESLKELDTLELEMTKLKIKKERTISELQRLGEDKNTDTTAIEKEILSLEEEVNTVERNLEEMRRRRAELEYDEQQYVECTKEESEVRNRLKHKVDQMSLLEKRRPLRIAKEKRLKFPDSQLFLGTLFELFRVKSSHSDYFLALEEASKTKLYQLVVKDDAFAQEVLDSMRDMKIKITCIPLNRIRPPIFPEDRVQRAQTIRAGKVYMPMECIDLLNKQCDKAVSYAFGTTLICENQEAAKMVASDSKIKLQAVTIAGDNYSPHGILSGGSRAGCGDVLRTFEMYYTLKREIEDLQKTKKCLTDRVARAEETKKNYELLCSQIELGKVTASLKRQSLYRKKLSSEQSQRIEIRKQLDELTKEETYLNEKISHLKMTRVPHLERIIQDAATNYELRAKKIKGEKENEEKEIQKTQEQLSTLRLSFDELRTKREILKGDVELAMREKEECEQTIRKLKEDIGTLRQDLQKATKERETCARIVEGLNNNLEKLRSSIDEKMRLRESKTACVIEDNKELRKLLMDMEKLRETQIDAKKALNQLKAMHPNVSHKQFVPQTSVEKQILEKTMTLSIAELEADVGELVRDRSTLSHKINKDIIAQCEMAEAEFQELENKRARVIEDRDSIRKFVDDLAEKKRIALENCHIQVSEFLSSIFSTLLPGANAKLNPVVPSDISGEGLELKVSLGGAWKNGLTELSGGQKSLLALSLILALLRLNPAPFYILDEIDAALDLSHTQNIGRMIKSHFSNSQFIIVSLKENFFNYADTLIRTSFVRGSSSVEVVRNSR